MNVIKVGTNISSNIKQCSGSLTNYLLDGMQTSALFDQCKNYNTAYEALYSDPWWQYDVGTLFGLGQYYGWGQWWSYNLFKKTF